MYYLGIDIGGTSVKVAARNGDSTVLTGQSPFYFKPGRIELIKSIRAAMPRQIDAVEAIGICVPGLLDSSGCKVVLSVNVPGLNGLVLQDLIDDALSLGISREPSVLNDAVAAGQELYHQRALGGRLLVLALGAGVGAAVLDEGIPLRVEGESPGHLGQIDVSIDDEPVVGSDGGIGGLEGYIGAHALARKYGDNVSAALEAMRGNEPPLRALVRAIRIAHAIYRPHHVILCGGIGIRLRRLMPTLRSMIEIGLTSLARPDWTFETGNHDFHAALGAAMVAESQAATTTR
jgi:predicted NBD/HSP70 family sugar kinase